MKITFFKNESHFNPRISYVLENAEIVNFGNKFQQFRKYSSLLLCVPAMIFVLSLNKGIKTNYLIFAFIFIFCLPLHELCHVLFCWISGRKVERICFFPYKPALSTPTAYVQPAFGVWNKLQTILFSLFPLLLLSVIPAMLAVFMKSFRTSLLFLSLLNLSVSHIDIIDTICLVKMPSKYLHFRDFILKVDKSDKPVIIHQLSVTPNPNKIDHRCFKFFENKLVEMDCIPDSPDVAQLRQHFADQFNL